MSSDQPAGSSGETPSGSGTPSESGSAVELNDPRLIALVEQQVARAMAAANPGGSGTPPGERNARGSPWAGGWLGDLVRIICLRARKIKKNNNNNKIIFKKINKIKLQQQQQQQQGQLPFFFFFEHRRKQQPIYVPSSNSNMHM